MSRWNNAEKAGLIPGTVRCYGFLFSKEPGCRDAGREADEPVGGLYDGVLMEAGSGCCRRADGEADGGNWGYSWQFDTA